MSLTTTALAAFLLAQAPAAPADLTTDERQAMQTITPQKLLGTVSFLSDDELGGRDTPSAELNIAAAYVAARFRGAGLEGGGPQGSFYQETTVDTVQAPASGVVFQTESDAVPYGLMFGGDEELRFSGEVPAAKAGAKFSGPVWMPAPEPRSSDPRAAMMLVASVVRSAASYSRAGATALIVVTPEGSPLRTAAQRFQAQPRLVGRRSLSSATPVLLVSAAPKGTTTLVLPPQQKHQAIVRNVIAVRRGSDEELAKQAILFTAHLDHIGRAAGKDPVNNGADDDASGVTAVLALADAYAALPVATQRSVIFMTYWGEEKGLLGSRYFADHPLWPLQDIVANINIEMVGRPESGAQRKCWMTGWNHSDLGSLMAIGAQRAGVTIFEHKKFSPMLYSASDNISLVRAGVVAHSFSAGSLHADYHQPGDEWPKLDIPHMTTVTQGLFAGSLPLARGQQTPQPKER